MQRHTLLPLFTVVLVTSTGCRNEGDIVAIDTGEVASEELAAEWEGASIEIVSPTAGEFLPLGEEAEFEFIVWSADGETLNPAELEDVRWSSSIDSSWSGFEAEFTDEDLSVGTHTIKAEVVSPTGERLFDAVGGVLVQSDRAGTYAGMISVSTETEEYQVGCGGGAIIVVEPTGEVGTGDAACLVSIQGMDIELLYNFNLELEDGGEVGGEVAAQVFTWEIPTDFAGSHEGEELTGEWSVEIGSYGELLGEISVERISRETSYGSE